MDRYGRRYSITETDFDLISPYHGFGPHDPQTSMPPRQVQETIEPLRKVGNWRSFFSPSTRFDSQTPEPLPQDAGSTKPLILSRKTSPKLTRKRRLWDKFHGGWRTGVALGALGAIIVLIINVGLLVWIRARYHVPNDGAATVFEGSCSQKTKISIWCHLAINVCSTLLLSASNNAMQVLSAPTRGEVDKAHTRGLWLDIGVTSIKNLRVAQWQRMTLWAVLVLSSIPLHLFYNSVISTTLSTTDYMAVVTTEDFLNGAAWNHSITPTVFNEQSQQSSGTSTTTSQHPLGVPNYDMISKLQNNSTSDLQRLNITTCIRTYNHEFISDWRNVLLISNATNLTNSWNAQDEDAVVAVVTDNTGIEHPNWFCAWEQDNGDCTPENIIKAESWYIFTHDDIKVSPAHVEYCLAESIEPHCQVTFNVFMLFISVICNAAKLAAFLLILLLPGFKPLITVGDAIASFLTYPDPVTVRIGAPAIAKDGSWTPPILSTPWRPQRCHWFCGASLRQWCVGILAIICIFVPALVVLITFTGNLGYKPSLKHLWKEGFGAVHTDFLVTIISTEIGTALVSNSPQLLLSVIYVSYNLLITSMMMTKEYNDFAVKRKPLRVSEPKGQQRSSYYLQLPYRYAVPLNMCSGTLHWLISQSLFQVKIIFYDNAGNLQPNGAISACGWSPIAVCFTLGLGGIMVLVLFALGCRKLNKGMPVMRSNSLDIGAACHPPLPNEDMALEPVSYGAADVKGYRSWYACFTNEPVVPLTRKYDGTFRLNLIADDGDELDLMLPTGKVRSEFDAGQVRESRQSVRESP